MNIKRREEPQTLVAKRSFRAPSFSSWLPFGLFVQLQEGTRRWQKDLCECFCSDQTDISPWPQTPLGTKDISDNGAGARRTEAALPPKGSHYMHHLLVNDPTMTVIIDYSCKPYKLFSNQS